MSTLIHTAGLWAENLEAWASCSQTVPSLHLRGLSWRSSGVTFSEAPQGYNPVVVGPLEEKVCVTGLSRNLWDGSTEKAFLSLWELGAVVSWGGSRSVSSGEGAC